MIRVLDIRPLLMIMINVLIMFILYTINDLICAYGIQLVVPVLFLLVPSVYLSSGKAMFVIAVTALLFEATLPIRGFSILIIWFLAALLIKTQRFRFRRIDFLEMFLLSVIVNTLIILSYGLFFFPSNLDFGSYMLKLFVDAFFSALFLIYTSSYILHLHHSIFRVLGLELAYGKDTEEC